MYQICILFLLIHQCLGIAYTVPDQCKHRPHKGGCNSKVDAWYYNAILNQCKEFEYTGCGGNPNRFLTEADCADVCKQQSIEEKTSNISLRNEVRTANEPQLCQLPKKTGNCTDDIPSVYYDSEQKLCRKFRYTGCGGNENRFEDSYRCHLMCGEGAQSRILVRLIDASIVREVCTYQPIRGPCLGRIISWHYDTGIRKCRQFIYSGCGGNLNRFSSEKECFDVCLPPKPKPATRVEDSRPPDVRRMCTQPIDEGNCTDTTTMWYFDHWSRNCFVFRYTGCGGNDNRFREQKDCLAMCAPPISTNQPVGKRKRKGKGKGKGLLNMSIFGASADDVCLLPPSWGDCAGYEMVWVFDTAYQQCRKFYYSGCGGNANQFGTREACIDTCHGPNSNDREVQKSFSAPPFCYLRPSPGRCSMRETYFFHHPATRTCRKFTYGGCGGNQNRFETVEKCESECLNVGRTVLSVCTLPPITKTCPKSSDRWFYNKELNGCELTRPDLKMDCVDVVRRSENSFISEGDCRATCVD